MFVALNVKDKLSALCPAAVLRAGLVISSHPRVQENPVADPALRLHALLVIKTGVNVFSSGGEENEPNRKLPFETSTTNRLSARSKT